MANLGSSGRALACPSLRQALSMCLHLQAYKDGRWEEAKNILVNCLNRIDPSGVSVTDGPTASLLEVMGRYDFIAPRNWK